MWHQFWADQVAALRAAQRAGPEAAPKPSPHFLFKDTGLDAPQLGLSFEIRRV